MQSFVSSAASAGASTKRFASDMSGALTGRRSLGQGYGQSIYSRFDTTPGAPLRPFEVSTGFHTEGSNKWAPPLPSNEDINPRITVQGRRIIPFAASALGNADLGPPSERQLALVWRARPKEANIYVPLGGMGSNPPTFYNSLAGAPQVETEVPGSNGMSVQAIPSPAAEPASKNFLITDLQREWAEVDGGEHYLRLTPEMLYYGTKDLDNLYPQKLLKTLRDKLPGFASYEGFEWDGIPRNTIAEDGTAPQYDDGIVRGMARAPRAGKTYTVAMTSHGAEMCQDYWKAEGLETGTLLYAILKKSPIEKYLHPDAPPGGRLEDTQSKLLFHLATKGHDEYRDGASMRRIISLPKIKVGGREVYMLPYEWHFVSSRTTLNREEHARYVDELGIVRYGLVVYLGSVLHPPPSGKIKGPTEPGMSVPYMDNRHAMRNEPMEIILNPDSGFRCAQ